jgi:hypothetical protein
MLFFLYFSCLFSDGKSRCMVIRFVSREVRSKGEEDFQKGTNLFFYFIPCLVF